MAFRGIIPRPDHAQLRFRPGHDRNAADAVLRATFDDPVAVGHIDQHVALLVEEAHDLKRLEDEAAPLVKDALAIFDFALDLDRADLPARDAGVAGVLGHAESALHSSGLGAADVAGDALDFGVVKTIYDKLVVGTQQPQLCIFGAGGARLRAGGAPPAQRRFREQARAFSRCPSPFLEGWPCPGDRIWQTCSRLLATPRSDRRRF